LLLNAFERQFGSFSDMHDEYNEDKIIRIMLAMLVSNRSLGFETIMLIDDNGNEVTLSERSM